MTIEGERPKLVVKRRNDHHKNGFIVSVEPSATDTHKVDVTKLLMELRNIPTKNVRRGRKRHDKPRNDKRS